MHYGQLSLVLEGKEVSMGTKAKAIASGAWGGIKGALASPFLAGMNTGGRMRDDYQTHGAIGIATGLGKGLFQTPGKVIDSISNSAHLGYYGSLGDKAKHKEYSKKTYDYVKGLLAKDAQKSMPKFNYQGLD